MWEGGRRADERLLMRPLVDGPTAVLSPRPWRLRDAQLSALTLPQRVEPRAEQSKITRALERQSSSRLAPVKSTLSGPTPRVQVDRWTVDYPAYEWDELAITVRASIHLQPLATTRLLAAGSLIIACPTFSSLPPLHSLHTNTNGSSKRASTHNELVSHTPLVSSYPADSCIALDPR